MAAAIITRKVLPVDVILGTLTSPLKTKNTLKRPVSSSRTVVEKFPFKSKLHSFGNLASGDKFLTGTSNTDEAD